MDSPIVERPWFQQDLSSWREMRSKAARRCRIQSVALHEMCISDDSMLTIKPKNGSDLDIGSISYLRSSIPYAPDLGNSSTSLAWRTDSDASFNLVNAWHSIYHQFHTKCHARGDDPDIPPKRLMGITPATSRGNFRLIETA